MAVLNNWTIFFAKMAIFDNRMLFVGNGFVYVCTSFDFRPILTTFLQKRFSFKKKLCYTSRVQNRNNFYANDSGQQYLTKS
jgi:hypothetical protein